MPMNRALFAKELEPGLNALFGLAYDDYDEQWRGVFDFNTSSKAFEEDTLLVGFSGAPDKSEGAAVSYDIASESWTARYVHTTVALAFALTEEAEEDNLYESLAQRYTKALARSMFHTKEVKAANILNRAFNTSYLGGDSKELNATDHPLTGGGTFSNELSTPADLNETSMEAILIQIAKAVDEKSIPVALMATKLVVPPDLTFIAERLLGSAYRTNTSDNDISAIYSRKMLQGGYHVMQRLTDTDAWFVKTDCPDGMKYFERIAIANRMEGDFETGNIRYKSRERYTFGWTDPRSIYASAGAA